MDFQFDEINQLHANIAMRTNKIPDSLLSLLFHLDFEISNVIILINSI